MEATLGDPELARTALAYWGLDDGPNFEGHNILFVPRGPDEMATALGMGAGALADLVDRLDTLPDIKDLAAALVPPRTAWTTSVRDACRAGASPKSRPIKDNRFQFLSSSHLENHR